MQALQSGMRTEFETHTSAMETRIVRHLKRHISTVAAHQARSSAAEKTHITEATSLMVYKRTLHAPASCGAYKVARVPHNSEQLQAAFASTALQAHPIISCLHCVTSLSGPAQKHLLTQPPTQRSHPTVFFVSEHGSSSTSPGRAGPRADITIILAFLPASDFLCALHLQGAVKPRDFPKISVLYGAWVVALAKYTQEAHDANAALQANDAAQWRAALLLGETVVSSAPMTLPMSQSRMQHDRGTTIRLSAAEMSHGAELVVSPSSLSSAENASIAATLSQYPGGAYDYSVSAIVHSALYAPGVTPAGTSGSPVKSFQHNFTTGEMTAFFSGMVMAYNANLQQTVISPLWPTVEPMQTLLDIAMEVLQWDVQQWQGCPMHRRGIQLGLVGAVDLTSGIREQVQHIIATAATCLS